jgi:hypothetical protein
MTESLDSGAETPYRLGWEMTFLLAVTEMILFLVATVTTRLWEALALIACLVGQGWIGPTIAELFPG